MGKVVVLNVDTTLDVPPDRILEAATGKLDMVLLLGYNNDDEPYFASSTSDRLELLWLLESAKKELLDFEGDF